MTHHLETNSRVGAIFVVTFSLPLLGFPPLASLLNPGKVILNLDTWESGDTFSLFHNCLVGGTYYNAGHGGH